MILCSQHWSQFFQLMKSMFLAGNINKKRKNNKVTRVVWQLSCTWIKPMSHGMQATSKMYKNEFNMFEFLVCSTG